MDKIIEAAQRKSALPRKRRSAVKMRSVAKGQTATYAVQQIPTTERKRSPSASTPARHADVEPRCPAFANLLVSISGLYAWELQLRKLAPIF